MTTGIDMAAHEAWVGRSEKAEDLIAPHVVRGMHAILDHDVAVAEGDELPPAWHWMFTLPAVRQSQLGADGCGSGLDGSQIVCFDRRHSVVPPGSVSVRAIGAPRNKIETLRSVSVSM